VLKISNERHCDFSSTDDPLVVDRQNIADPDDLSQFTGSASLPTGPEQSNSLCPIRKEITMKVFIIGIAGGTGSRLGRLLKSRSDEVGGLYRRSDQGAQLSELGIKGTLGDLIEMTDQALAEVMRGSDVVVFSAGAGNGDSEASTDAVDGDGVAKASTAAKLAGIERLILVSVFPEAWRERRMPASFEHYMTAKKRADVALAASDLNWVILRPSALTNDPGVGSVSLGLAQIHSEVSRDDVAATLAELVHMPGVRRVILELTEGTTPIAEAVTKFIFN
jgi:uncharacterized protein YbjT (DUF2867 family)